VIILAKLHKVGQNSKRGKQQTDVRQRTNSKIMNHLCGKQIIKLWNFSSIISLSNRLAFPTRIVQKQLQFDSFFADLSIVLRVQKHCRQLLAPSL